MPFKVIYYNNDMSYTMSNVLIGGHEPQDSEVPGSMLTAEFTVNFIKKDISL